MVEVEAEVVEWEERERGGRERGVEEGVGEVVLRGG